MAARPPAVTEDVEGLRYVEDFVSEEEERALLDYLAELDFRAVTMRGQTAKRTVRHFGLDYDYENWKVKPGDPLPDELEWLRARAAALVEVEPDELAQILVTRYPAGAPIGWHRDAPMFGRIVGVSLGAPARMRFQRGKGESREVAEVVLEPRSAYVLDGPARTQWQHSIPPVKELRYSITFRTLRQGASRAPRSRSPRPAA
jgi:alkylated DNA repair protein (DNA oxidative demethylase)